MHAVCRLYTEFLLRFKKLISNMGLKFFSDLIKILCITKFLKSYSQMLSVLVGRCYTLKLSLHTPNYCLYGAHLFSKILHD